VGTFFVHLLLETYFKSQKISDDSFRRLKGVRIQRKMSLKDGLNGQSIAF